MQATPFQPQNDNSASPAQRVLFGLALMAAGTLVLLSRLDLVTLPALHTLWPVFLILGGASMLLRRRPPVMTTAGGRIDLAFSGLSLDLAAANLQGDEAVLDVSACFSSLELRVPADWQVVVEMSAFAGSVVNRAATPAAPARRVVLRGRTVFGGVEIRN